MRPEFGCRIHDYVFASADGATASAIAAEVATALRRWEPRIDVDDVAGHVRRPGRRRPVHRHPLRDPADQRPPQPRVPVLRDPGRRLTMALPVPNLDDRRFQDLVDDAKRLVQQRCPEWTDHNVSDPGVTLIELFAWMTDQLVYRLNRVPGPQLRQVPRAHRRQPLSADGRPLRTSRSGCRRRSRTSSRSPPGRRSPRSAPTTDEAIAFTTVEDLPIVPSELAAPGLDDRRQDAARPHGRAREGHRGLLLPEGAVRRATRCTSACPRRSRRTRSGCASGPTSTASASTRPTRRSPGRRGPATTGSRASSTPTPPAASTATATSSSTSRTATWRR